MYAFRPQLQTVIQRVKGGYLYIVTNEAFPKWVKVGTTQNLTERLHVYQTCDPHRGYKLVYSLCHPLYKEAEKKIKETMKHFALDIKGEWYRIDLEMAKSRLEEQLDDYNDSKTTFNDGSDSSDGNCRFLQESERNSWKEI